MNTLVGMLGDLAAYVDARIAAARAADQDTMRAVFGTITQTDPLRVRLDGEAAPLDYAPPCTYRPQVGDRVQCARWGRNLAVLGPVAGGPPYLLPPADTGWTNCSFYTPNGFAQSSGSDKAQSRVTGGRVMLRGSFRRTAAGGGFGNGILVGLPQSPQTQHVGTAQWESGARCDLVIYAGDTEVVPDIIASSGTFGVGWVRIGAGAGYTLDPW